MEEAVIVIMLKNESSGFLEKELGSYRIDRNENLIVNIYTQKEKNKDSYIAFMKLTTDRDTEDWEFEAVYDYYDLKIYTGHTLMASEIEGCFNPTWELQFEFAIDNHQEMEKKINFLLTLHAQELNEVYAEIQDKAEEYQS